MAVESILPKVVLITAFFGCLFLLTVAVAPLIVESERPSMATIGTTNIMDAFMDEYLVAWTPSSFLVNSSDASAVWHPKSAPMVEFTSGGGEEHPLKCWLVRGDPFKSETADYLVFQQIFGWFGMKERHAFISYKYILSQFESLTNYSRFSIDLRYQFEVFIWSNDTPGLAVEIWDDEYKMTVGYGLNESMDSISPWGMVGKIMTFRMPGVPGFINILIAAPIYTMLIFMGWFIIRSAIPFLGG